VVQEMLASELDAKRLERRRAIAEEMGMPEATTEGEVDTLAKNVRAMGRAMPTALQAEKSTTELLRARRERLAEAAAVDQDQEGGA
jgi:predicted GIY-YIG superfamily endonuclease